MTTKPKIKNVILAGAGKGGTGKSTMSVLIALRLKELGYNVGLFDADIFGPSLPLITGTTTKLEGDPEKGVIPSKTTDGIPLLSIDLFLNETKTAILWKGTKVANYIKTIYDDINWGDKDIDFLVVDLPPGCLYKDSLVLKSNGEWKKISDIIPGDKLSSVNISLTKNKYREPWKFSSDTIENEVSAVIPNGTQDIYELNTNTRTIKATSNHPFLCLTRRRKDKSKQYTYATEWKNLSSLKRGDYISVLKKHTHNEVIYKLPVVETNSHVKNVKIPEYTTEDFMRLVGYFIGDGYIKKDGGILSALMLCEPTEGKYREKYIDICETLFGCKAYTDDMQFGIISTVVAKLFDNIGLNKKCKLKTIPEWIFRLPKEQRLAFVEGYTDADGHRRRSGKNNGRTREGNIEFSCANKHLMEQMKMLCISIGMRCSNIIERERNVFFDEEYRYIKSTCYEFCIISCKKRERIHDYSAQSFFRSNLTGNVGKRGACDEHYGFDKIKSIEYVGKEEVYDLSMKDTPNFISEGIVVHNSGESAQTIISVVQERNTKSAILFISAPQKVSIHDVLKSISMAKRLNVPILGIVENETSILCPNCKFEHSPFGSGKVEEVCKEEKIQYIKGMRIIPEISSVSDISLNINTVPEEVKPYIAEITSKVLKFYMEK